MTRLPRPPRVLVELVARIWHSATLMSWLSIGVRSLGLIAVLPLLLSRLPAEEVALWYLLLTLSGFQMVADGGFSPTFIRVLSFARAPRARSSEANSQAVGPADIDWARVDSIWGSMQVVYTRLAMFAVPIFVVAGSLSLKRPIAQLAEPAHGWLAWSTIVVGFAVVLRLNAFSAYVQGMNEVALVRRWEAAMGLLGMVSVVVVLLAGGRILALVITNQMWVIASALRDWALARSLNGGRARAFRRSGLDPDVVAEVWGPAMKSGIGVLMSRGVLATGGLLLAQVTASAPLAGYLLATRLMQVLVEFTNAPFYSKLPALARFWAMGAMDDVAQLAARGIQLALGLFVAGAIAVQLLFPTFLLWTGSDVEWVAPSLWGALVIAYFIERYGALHLQLYSITNDIRWHVANGVSGTLYLVVSASTLQRVGVYAFPLGIAIGYAAFYSWYGPWKVRVAFPRHFWRLQRNAVLAPALVLVLYAFGLLWTHRA